MRVLSLAAVLVMLAASPVLAQSSTTAPSKAPSSASQSAPKQTAPTDKSAAAPSKGGTQTAQALIDINSASQSDLDALPGVGPSRAQAIVAGRPFKSKDELVQRKIIPQNVYDDIKDRIIARQK